AITVKGWSIAMAKRSASSPVARATELSALRGAVCEPHAGGQADGEGEAKAFVRRRPRGRRDAVSEARLGPRELAQGMVRAGHVESGRHAQERLAELHGRLERALAGLDRTAVLADAPVVFGQGDVAARLPP